MTRPGDGREPAVARVGPRPRVVGHAAVRAAAKDWQRFSSELQGDRDVRGYRQLPLEVDPPRHTGFRRALAPLFADAAMARHQPRFTRHARGLIHGLSARGGGDVVTDLALPYVVGCLTIVMGRPQDYDEWLSWGPDVWTARAHATRHDDEVCRRGPDGVDGLVPTRSRPRSGEPLHRYLERVLDRAEARLLDGDARSSATSRRDVWTACAG